MFSHVMLCSGVLLRWSLGIKEDLLLLQSCWLQVYWWTSRGTDRPCHKWRRCPKEGWWVLWNLLASTVWTSSLQYHPKCSYFLCALLQTSKPPGQSCVHLFLRLSSHTHQLPDSITTPTHSYNLQSQLTYQPPSLWIMRVNQSMQWEAQTVTASICKFHRNSTGIYI